jgi:hypothetical protein
VGSLADARSQVDQSLPPRRFEPEGFAAWREARERYAALEPGS